MCVCLCVCVCLCLCYSNQVQTIFDKRSIEKHPLIKHCSIFFFFFFFF